MNVLEERVEARRRINKFYKNIFKRIKIGRNRRILANAELLWSLPGMDKSFRMGWFVDAGEVYAPDDKLSLDELRMSTGVSAAWISPIGPLKFSLGKPLNKKNGDRAEPFQFQMGTTF